MTALIVSCALFVLLAASVRHGREMGHVPSTQLLAPDRAVTRLIEPLSGRTVLLNAFRWASELFIVATLLIFLAANWRYRRSVHRLTAPATVLTAYLVGDRLLKPLVDRRIIVPDVYLGPPTFPSGHATVAWAAVFGLLTLGPRRDPAEPPRTGYATTVGVAVGMAVMASATIVLSLSHFLTDVVGGMLLAVSVTSIIRLTQVWSSAGHPVGRHGDDHHESRN